MTDVPLSVSVDTHTHLYPEFGVERWLDAAVKNLSGGAGLVIVTDREGQDSLLAIEQAGVACSRVGAAPAREITRSEKRLIVVQGVQYVARERIEVLGLGVGRTCADKAPAAELVQTIIEAGGVPCLPWSPGKWLGARGHAVRALMKQFGPKALTLGDIAIRSSLGPPSILLSQGRQQGFRILFGSDVLPRLGEEQGVGRFGTELHPPSTLHGEELVRWVLRAFLDPEVKLHTWGRRNGPVCAAMRMGRGFLKEGRQNLAH